jgi:hypothetical protein
MNEVQHGNEGSWEREAKRPYRAPRVESAEAFERVQLASNCDSTVGDGCDVPCDE